MKNVLAIDGLRIHTVPKVASTSISHAIPRDITRIAPEEKGGDWRFMCVRHPLDRLVSAWRFFVPRLEHMRVFRHDIHEGMTFPAFLTVVLKDPYKDRHTTPQVAWKGGQYINDLVRLEGLPDGWERLRRRYAFLKPIPHKNETQHDRWQAYFDGAMARDALVAYGDDLELYENAQTADSIKSDRRDSAA